MQFAPHPQCDSLIERMIELRMELARKPAGTSKQENQQQQAKWVGSRDVRGVAVKIKVEEEGTQFVGKEERHERRADEFGENGGMAMAGGASSGSAEPFGEEHNSFGGDDKEVTCDVLPGVSTVSLSLVSKENTMHNVVCVYTIPVSPNVCLPIYSCDRPLCMHANHKNQSLYYKQNHYIWPGPKKMIFKELSFHPYDRILNYQGRGHMMDTMMARGGAHWGGSRYGGDSGYQDDGHSAFLELRASANPQHAQHRPLDRRASGHGQHFPLSAR